MQAIEKYANGLKTGLLTGFSLIDELPDGQIEILCNIATAVSKKPVTGKDGLKDFSRNAPVGDKTFNRYVENVLLAMDDLKAAE